MTIHSEQLLNAIKELQRINAAMLRLEETLARQQVRCRNVVQEMQTIREKSHQINPAKPY